jgi:hypothetical protein
MRRSHWEAAARLGAFRVAAGSAAALIAGRTAPPGRPVRDRPTARQYGEQRPFLPTRSVRLTARGRSTRSRRRPLAPNTGAQRPRGCSVSGSCSRVRRSLPSALTPARSARAARRQTSAVGTSHAANRGSPTHIATTKGTAAAGAGARTAPAQIPALTTRVSRDAISTSAGLPRPRAERVTTTSVRSPDTSTLLFGNSTGQLNVYQGCEAPHHNAEARTRS